MLHLSEQAEFKDMVRVAAGYQFLGMQAEPEDRVGSRQHQRYMTKSALDNWLMKKFDIDAADARAVSNAVGEMNPYETQGSGTIQGEHVKWTHNSRPPTYDEVGDVPWKKVESLLPRRLIYEAGQMPPTLYLTFPEFLAEALPDFARDEITESLTEASIASLWGSAQKAFPRTQRRQHVINRVRTESVKWQGFPGLKVLLASSRVLGEQYPGKTRNLYRTYLMFRDVTFSESAKPGYFRIDSRGVPHAPKNLYFEALAFGQGIRLRCNCPDFQYRFNWECEAQSPSALFGPKAPPYTPPNPERYRGPANPSGLPGLCKHGMNMALALHKANVIKMS